MAGNVQLVAFKPVFVQAQPNNMGDAQAADAPLPTGRLLTYADITPALKNRQAEVCICLTCLQQQCQLCYLNAVHSFISNTHCDFASSAAVLAR